MSMIPKNMGGVTGDIEEGNIINGVLYRYSGNDKRGKKRFEQTSYIFNHPVPDGPCKFRGKIIFSTPWDPNKGPTGPGVIIYEAEIFFEWIKLK